jgi:hypothetical protein
MSDKPVNFQEVLYFLLNYADLQNIKLLHNNILKEVVDYEITWDNLSFEELKQKTIKDKLLIEKQEIRQQALKILHNYIENHNEQ